MPTSINWPDALPAAQRQGYSVGPRSALAEAEFALLPRRAQIYSASLDVLTVQWVFTAAQAQAFRSFYTYDLSVGTQWFNMPVLYGGQVVTREVMFLRASPSFVPNGATGSRVTATVITRGGALPPPVYELSATYAINIDALDFGDDSPFGATQTITTLATDKVVITKPSIATDPELTWDAWSPWASDGASPPGTGLTWINDFEMYDEDDASLLAYVTARLVNPAAALAAAQADMPMEFTGHTAYRIGHYDPAPGDNRAGLSLRVDVYSLVP